MGARLECLSDAVSHLGIHSDHSDAVAESNDLDLGAFAIDLLNKGKEKTMRFWRCMYYTLLLCIGLGVASQRASAAETRDAEAHFFGLGIGDLKAELAEARAKGKQALLVVFEQEGCPACLYMKRNVLNRVDIQEFYGKAFVNLSLDINGSIPLRDFAGREVTEKAYAQTAKIKGTPTFVFYDLDGAEIVRAAGTVKTGEFRLLGRFVATGAYKTRSLSQFMQNSSDEKGKRSTSQ